MNPLPDGLIVVAKRDCPTCLPIEPVLRELATASTPLTVFSQDDPAYAVGLRGVVGGLAADLAQESGPAGFAAATYRDRSGLGRNLTIEVLEFLDRSGVPFFRDVPRAVRGEGPVVT